MVLFYSDVFPHVPSTRIREVIAMFKSIYAQENKVAAQQKAVLVIGKLKAVKLNAAGQLLEKAIHEILTY